MNHGKNCPTCRSSKSRKVNTCLPLAIWTIQDIDRYIKENNITINPLYSQMKRTGCMFCSGFKKWKSVMAKYNPKMYSHILSKKEGQRTIDCEWS